MVTVFSPTETLKRPSADLLFKTSFFFPTPELPPPTLVLSATSPAVLWERAQARALWRVWTCLRAHAGMFQRLLSTARAYTQEE